MNKGERITLSNNVRHAEFRGQQGTIERVIKSRNMVVVICDNGQYYDALPENVIPTERSS